MFQTILTSSHISVQGEYVKTLPDGRVVVRTGDRLHIGTLIKAIKSTIAQKPEAAGRPQMA